MEDLFHNLKKLEKLVKVDVNQIYQPNMNLNDPQSYR